MKKLPYCVYRENCNKECNDESDMNACNTLRKGNYEDCPLCKNKKRVQFRQVLNPDSGDRFIFLTCACGFSGAVFKMREPADNIFDYIAALKKWDKQVAATNKSLKEDTCLK